jgi:glycerol-3-phosphate acyltransferase PlsY
MSVEALGIGLIIAGYLLGSIPFGLVVSRALGKPDPRTTGSRNIGFTNVLRVSGTLAGVLTLVGDATKGWLIGWVAAHVLDEEVWILGAALSPILGHLHSLFLRFQGGKGVATALGAIAGVAPGVGIILLAIWLGAVGIWRYSSGGAISAFAALPFVAWASGRGTVFVSFGVIVSALILSRHGQNMVRLYQGREPRIGSRS